MFISNLLMIRTAIVIYQPVDLLLVVRNRLQTGEIEIAFRATDLASIR